MEQTAADAASGQRFHALLCRLLLLLLYLLLLLLVLLLVRRRQQPVEAVLASAGAIAVVVAVRDVAAPRRVGGRGRIAALARRRSAPTDGPRP